MREWLLMSSWVPCQLLKAPAFWSAMLNARVSLTKVYKEPNNKVVIFENQIFLLKRIKEKKSNKHKCMQCKNGKTRTLQNGNRNVRPQIKMAKEVFEDHFFKKG